ncbi:hypothetical protein HOLleu_34017 [Holothuria leucospilota]|uniref:CCHC-type domain-containing protein n=1 Tax=Holothuria leucospilota TaxID=206669 RepID=A0A9Q1BH13_HOLLE|nr:hypothetical protein HOLleu_34017 [Holothuria leucospilota]
MFQEDRDSMDAFLLRFENYATVHGWDRDKEWAVNLSNLLTGKGLEAYSALSAEEMKNYDVLKTAILKRYRLTEDGFRSKFRAAKPENGETPGQFIFRLSTYATRWIELSETKKTYEELLNLIVKEQFLRSVHKDLSLFLKERYPKDLKAMASMAEKYLEAHGRWPNRPRSAPNQTSNNSSNNTKPQNTGQGHARPLKRTCFVCGKEGHLARNCRNRVRSTTAACVSEERNSNQGESSLDSEIPVNVTNHQSQTLSNEMVGSNPSETACMVHVIKGDCHIESALKEGEVTLQCGHKLPLLSAACSESKRCLLPVTPGFVGLEKVQVLRDTGCSGVVVRSNLVKDEQLTGETRTCVLIDNTVRRFPLAKISISTPYFTGQVKAMCMTNPVYDLVLGNIPEIAAADDKVVQSKFNAKNDKGIQTEVIHTRSFSTSTTEIVGTVETRGQLGKSKAFKPLRVSSGSQVLSVDDLKEAQNMDPTLRKCREMVGKGQETKNQKKKRTRVTFSRIMRALLHGMSNVNNYIDDILIHTGTWGEHLTILKELLKRLRKVNLTARPKKCFVGYEEIEFLGHIVGHGSIRPKQEKTEAIRKAERPKTKKQLRSFLGLVGFYRRYIPNFAMIACPLTDLTKKGEPNNINWSESQELAFHTLKEKITNPPILHLPDITRQFTLRTDASEDGIGAVLLQEQDGVNFPVAFASKKLNKCQKRYAAMERECLAVIWGIQKFSPYLYGREFVLETDHQPLSCINKTKVTNGRILRWALALQPYRFRVVTIKGSDNVGADYMSRSECSTV